MLPSIGDIKFSNLNSDQSCTYMNKKYAPNMDSSKYLAELKTYCNKIKPFVSHYSKNHTMYFTINLAFSNYLELMPNITDQLTLNRGKTNFAQPLPVYLNVSCYDTSLSNRPGKLKEFIHNYMKSTNNKEIFELQKKTY